MTNVTGLTIGNKYIFIDTLKNRSHHPFYPTRGKVLAIDKPFVIVKTDCKETLCIDIRKVENI